MNPFVVKITVFFLAVSNFVFSQNTLEYKLNIGDNLSITQVSTQQIIQDITDSNHEMSNNIECDFNLIVTAKTDSSYLINFRFMRFKLQTTSNIYGDLMNIDTNLEIKDDDFESKMFSGLTNSVLKIEMLKNGKIRNVSGTDAMIQKMVYNAGIEDEFTKELTIEALKKEYGNESLSKSFEQVTYFYPKKKVLVGDQWTNKYTGDLLANNTWTLIDLSKNITLNAKSNVTMASEEGSYVMNLKGTQETQIIANKLSGFPESITVNSTTKGTTVMNQMENIEIPTTIISKTTYKTKKNVQ
ncbi:DUF6263 family protein [Bizionia arctica]|uniref:DUF4412 domain-containing protein n=1 Tax=Bizionia arctica TaxID=1495645 RepID=A0A917GWF3_9FLAO|nr:DUF6263 family protein [Bizionia arctica]GGG59329.1 hypothetical protein GCM10010976_32600 [Bizionia arctica]